MKYQALLIFCFISLNVFCQYNVGIGTTAPAKDAILDVKSSTQGILVPRLSTTQRLAIVKPSNGLLVYDTNYNCFYYYNAQALVWNSMCAGPTGPTKNSTTQVFYSQGVSTYISGSTVTTVNGLSLSVTLVDTSTVILSSNGSIIDAGTAGNGMGTVEQLYMNSTPITGTAQNNSWLPNYTTSPAILTNTNWSISTVLPSLPPGTYLFELKAKHTAADDFYAAGSNQGIITAEVIH